METVQPAIATEPVVPPVETPAPSIADHAAQFDPKTREAEPVAESPARGQRSSKQAATREDVPRIKELTAKWREEERKTKALEAELATYKAKPPTVTTEAIPAKPAQTGTAFPKPEPQLKDFETAEDPYQEWTLAKGEWRSDKRAFDADQAKQATARAEADTKEQAAFHEQAAQFGAKVQAFMADHPDYQTVVEGIKDEQPPPLLMAAIMADDNGAAFVYHLAQSPADRLQLHLLTDGKPVTPSLVAQTRRLLEKLTESAGTGAASSQPFQTAPKPLTPVRTGPLKTGAVVPGDIHSIADHARAFGPTRSR